MATTAETGRHSRQNTSQKTLLGLGLLSMGGAYMVGLATDPAATSHGGGMVFEECTDSVTTMTLLEGQQFQLGVGDLSVSGLQGLEDVISFEMVDGSLSVKNPDHDAEEYIGSEQRIIAAGHDMRFMENGVSVVIALDENQGITATRTC